MQQGFFFSSSHFFSLLPAPPKGTPFLLTAAVSKLRAKWPTALRTSRVSTQAHRAEMGLPGAHILLTTVCNASPKVPAPFSLLFSGSPGADTQVSPQVRPVFWLCGTNSFLLYSGYLLRHQVIRPLLQAKRWKEFSLPVCFLGCLLKSHIGEWWLPLLLSTSAPPGRSCCLSWQLRGWRSAVLWRGLFPIHASLRQQLPRCYQGHLLLLQNLQVFLKWNRHFHFYQQSIFTHNLPTHPPSVRSLFFPSLYSMNHRENQVYTMLGLTPPF